MIPISSNQNSLIKEIKALKIKKHREERKQFFIEGTRFVEEALKEKANIANVLVSDKLVQSAEGKTLIAMMERENYKLYHLPDTLFKDISDTDNPQGILAVVNMESHGLHSILRDSNNFIVVLEAIQDPGNLGTIIRTADAAGATGIILSKGCVDVYNPKVLRSTMGSVFHVPICASEDLLQDLTHVKSKGIKVYAAHLKGKLNYYEVDSWSNSAVIIGNEAKGISEETAEAAHVLVKIPMIGRAESLNASVAAGLLIYEGLRDRLKPNGTALI